MIPARTSMNPNPQQQTFSSMTSQHRGPRGSDPYNYPAPTQMMNKSAPPQSDPYFIQSTQSPGRRGYGNHNQPLTNPNELSSASTSNPSRIPSQDPRPSEFLPTSGEQQVDPYSHSTSLPSHHNDPAHNVVDPVLPILPGGQHTEYSMPDEELERTPVSSISSSVSPKRNGGRTSAANSASPTRRGQGNIPEPQGNYGMPSVNHSNSHPDRPSKFLGGEKTTSSAIPYANITDNLVPRLRAEVHEYGTAFFDQIRVGDSPSAPSDIRFEKLKKRDMEECRALHAEWFPIAYDEGFYRSIANEQILTLGAYFGTCLLGLICVSFACTHHSEIMPYVLGTSCETECGNFEEEQAHGRFTPQDFSRGAVREEPNYLYGEAEDDLFRPAPPHGLHANNRSPSSSTRDMRSRTIGINNDEKYHETCGSGVIAYILTLGVIDEMRRRGLGRKLIQEVIRRCPTFHQYRIEEVEEDSGTTTGGSSDLLYQAMEDPDPLASRPPRPTTSSAGPPARKTSKPVQKRYCSQKIKALALHVVPYNTAAVNLYESLGFLRISSIDNFYLLHGEKYSALIYAYYFDNHKPPFWIRVRMMLKNWLKINWW
ncbi:unnamed protein product [Amoebophrya sp. A120]|nr:unnamed protein product [Amoebophrya sp. A120]|eukprot:GSA120T00006773001.1